MSKLEVYFQNGRVAKFDPEKVSFDIGELVFEGFSPKQLENGKIIINTGAISFVRMEPEKQEDDE